MKHKILKTFRGSQDGRYTETFTKGEERYLTDYLAGIVVPEGWAKPVRVDVDNKAIVTDGRRKTTSRKTK